MVLVVFSYVLPELLHSVTLVNFILLLPENVQM